MRIWNIHTQSSLLEHSDGWNISWLINATLVTPRILLSIISGAKKKKSKRTTYTHTRVPYRRHRMCFLLFVCQLEIPYVHSTDEYLSVLLLKNFPCFFFFFSFKERGRRRLKKKNPDHHKSHRYYLWRKYDILFFFLGTTFLEPKTIETSNSKAVFIVCL